VTPNSLQITIEEKQLLQQLRELQSIIGILKTHFATIKRWGVYALCAFAAFYIIRLAYTLYTRARHMLRTLGGLGGFTQYAQKFLAH
jgi:hypothetical protein